MRTPHFSFAGRWLLATAGFFILAVRALAIIGAAYQMQLGNPSSATTDNSDHVHYLIQRDQYAMDYNDTTRQPNWVSWDLTTADIGSSGRTPSFYADTNLPAGFVVVQPTDYSGSGYDRGHMCPSADRTITTNDNLILFYMSNMIPQAPDNNQGVWASFETYCRTLASAGNEVLITSGPSGFAGSTVASGVAIPGYTWKIAVVVPLGAGDALSRINASTRVIAIKIPNVQGVRSDPWTKYVTSVSQIQTATGYTFFTALPSEVASVLRTVVDGQVISGSPTITTQPTAQSAGLGGTATYSVTASGNAPLTYQWNKDDQPLDGQTSITLTLTNIQLSDAGTYTVTVSNSVGSVTSSSAQLNITGLPPSITTSPSNQSVSAGSLATFTVVAAGSPTLTYQWRKDTAPLSNGGSISGATSPVLTISNAQAADAGSYDVVVTNSVNSATSGAATLAVSPAGPSITTQPAVSPTVSVGSTATLSVVAKGTAPLSYQWRKNNVPITGNASASTASLVLPNVQAGDAGTYDVQVNNDLGPLVTSNTSTLAVNTSSTIVWTFGSASPWSAVPTSGLPTDVTGGTVTANNSFGATTMLSSTSASNTYAGASGSGNAGVAANIGALNTASTSNAYFEVSLTPAVGKQLNVTALQFGTRGTTTAPISYAIYCSANGYVSPIATGIGAIPNTSTWTLITPTFLPQMSAIATPLTLRIYGYDGTGSPSSGTINWRIDDLNITVNTVAASSQAPAVQSSTPANNATEVPLNSGITVSFNQTVNFSGSWFAISSAINGPMAATVTGGPLAYTLTPPVNFTPGDTITVTVYSSQITDRATGVLHPDSDFTMSFRTSLPVVPSVTLQPVPVAATVGSPASFTVTATGTLPLSYQWRKDGVAITSNATATSATLSIASVQAGDGGSYDVVVTNAVGTVTSDAAALAVTAPPPVAVYWDFTAATPTSGLPADVTGGMIVQGNNLGTTTLITVPSAPSNYSGASATSCANLTARVGALSQAASASGYFETSFTPAAGKKVIVTGLSFGSLSTSAGPRAYKVFSSLDGYVSPVASGPMTNNNTWTLYAPIFTRVAGAVDAVVTLRIYGYNGAGTASSGTANWRIDDLKIAATAVLPPGILSSPASASVTVGTDATLTVVATGSDTLTYQWRKGGVAITDNASALTASLVLTSVQTADTGSYTVDVTNAAGSVTSVAATLTVNKQTQAITFAGPANQGFTASGIALGGTADSGLTVTYAVVSGPATVSGSTLTLTGIGTVVVRASQSGNGTYAAATDVDQSFTVSANYASWQQGKFTAGELSNVSISGPAADPDADGISNLLEYALALEPKTADRAGVPTIGTTVVSSQKYLTYTYTHQKPATAPDLTYTLVASTDLAGWSPITPVTLATVDQGASESVTVRDTVAIGATRSRFLRLSISTQSTTATTPAIGAVTLPTLANSDTLVSVPLARPSVYQDKLSVVNGTVLTVTGTPGWTANQFVKNLPTQANTYYVQLKTGSAAGHFYTVTANAASTLTVDWNGETPSVAAGDQLELIPYWSLGTLYPPADAGVSFTSSVNAAVRSTELIFPDLTYVGINPPTAATYYFASGAWHKVGAAAATSFSDLVLTPDSYFVQRNKASASQLTALGTVVTGPLATLLSAQGGTAKQDNPIALRFAGTVTLAQSNLVGSGVFQSSVNAALRKDELLVYDNTASGINKSISATYYYSGGAWRKVGASASADFGTDAVFAPGTGVILRKAGTGAGNSAQDSFWIFIVNP